MGLTASIDLQMYGKTIQGVPQSINQIDILQVIKYSNWSFFNNERWCAYLPIHDDGNFDWQEAKFSEEELFKIFQIKSQFKEIIGTRIWWDNSEYWVDILLSSNLTLSLIIERGVRPINFYGITDFDWFLSRIIPLFKNTKHIGIQSIKFDEHI